MVTDAPFPLDILQNPGPAALERLLSGWLGPAPIARSMAARARARAIPDGDTGEDLRAPAIALPPALSKGLATLGRWPDVFRRNHLRTAGDVDVAEGLGRFLVEQDNHAFWGFALKDARLPDPRVWIEDVLDGRRLADARTSRFLLKATLLELILGDCTTEAGPGLMAPADLVLGLVRLDALGPLTWPTTCWFYAGPDDLAMTMDDVDGAMAWAWRAVRRPIGPEPVAIGR